MKPPVARRIPHPHTLHGDTRHDDYYWLRERENPEAIDYLEAENAYFDAVTKPLEPLAERVYQDMLARIQQDKVEVPVQDGPYFYYSRTEEGKQYRIHARKRSATRKELGEAPEEVLLDLNRLAEGLEFYSITVLRVSPDHARLAYLENRDGTDRYVIRVRDLESGQELSEAIPDVFLYGSLEWDRTGEYLFYVTVDESQRPCRLWRHHLGDLGSDTLLYEESDATYGISLSKTRSGRHLVLHCQSKVTGEARYLPADAPLGDWRLFRERRTGVEYEIEDWRDDFLVLTNDNAQNFRLMATAIASGGQGDWRELIAHDPGRYLQAVFPFADALLVAGRMDGLTQLWTLCGGRFERAQWPEAVYTVSVAQNREYSAGQALVTYESLVTPQRVYELDLTTLGTVLLQEDEVPGHYAPQHYVQERLWATADDGTRIPMSLVRRGDAASGPAPLLLYGYGSYGMSIDPGFDASRLALLDRGVVFVIAHVRGGGEMGRHWYGDGKFLKKRNTFTDFVACAEDLVRRGRTTPDRLAARGRSAGGLLMGAVLNLRPDLFRVVSAGVPFVDVVTTMLDASIPLTSLEWDEWGNPQDPEFYAYMKSYSPYDNIAAQNYPHIFVYAGLNDPRVGYFEPAKWVARLRELKTGTGELALRTHMGAGHGGSSGRYAKLRELATEYAFLLHHLGIES